MTASRPPTLKKDWRFYTGLAVLVLANLLPLMAVVWPLLGLPAGVTAAFIGGSLVGGPDVLTLIAVALLGKETFVYLIYRAKRIIKAAVTVGPVSRVRYYLGLAIAVLSIVPLSLYGYAPKIMPSGNARLYIVVAADLSFVVSMFIMGGEFWEKLRRLFIWEGDEAPVC